jgi:phage shock protein PspC (stress-responsive transcriptional regulator)
MDMTNTPITATAAPTRPAFTLRRSRTDRMLGGVCGGLGAELGIDPLLLRIALVVATVLGFGLAAVLYVVLWIMVPVAGDAA